MPTPKFAANRQSALQALNLERAKPDFFFKGKDKIFIPHRDLRIRAIEHVYKTGEPFNLKEHIKNRKTITLKHLAA